MHIDVIDNSNRLTELRGNWDSIYQADPEAQLFLSSTWIRNWFDHVDRPWMVLAARATLDARDYVAFFPLQLGTEVANGGGLYNSIYMGCAGLPVYAGLICRPEFVELAIPAFAAAIKDMNWAAFYLSSMAVSDERLRLLTAEFQEPAFTINRTSRVTDGDTTNYLIYPFIRLPNDWESYLSKNLGRNTRKRARRCMRLIDEGEYRVTHASEETFERDLDILSRLWEARWLPEKGVDQARVELDSHRVMLRACFAAGTVFMPVLWHGDTAIGVRARLIDKKNRSLICLIGARVVGGASVASTRRS